VTVSIAVVCEAPADYVTITTLADRLILEAAAETAPWIDGPEILPSFRRWRGFRSNDTHLEWTGELSRLAAELKILVRFRGEYPLHPYSQNAYRAILVLARSPDPVDGIILFPDSDCDLDRLKGLEQARRYARSAVPIAIGLAHTKRECWHLSGFLPDNDGERTIAGALRGELGHDPWLRTENLPAKDDTDKRSAKRVLATLCGSDHERVNRCLTSTPVDVLCDRGAENGLAAFITELRTHIVPLVLGVQPPPTQT
jgi:hypothetical protein